MGKGWRVGWGDGQHFRLPLSAKGWVEGAGVSDSTVLYRIWWYTIVPFLNPLCTPGLEFYTLPVGSDGDNSDNPILRCLKSILCI